MRVVVAAVGRPRDGALAAAIRDYETRAARYWPLDVIEVKADRSEERGGPAVAPGREGERLRERTAGIRTLVACDPGGRSMTSEDFAAWLHRQREQATDVAFLIGGAFGLDPSLVGDTSMRLALAPWTLPHELARLVLAEQLYRAGTIVRGEPYHK